MATYYDALNRAFRLFEVRQLPAAPQLVMCWIMHLHNRAGNVGQVEISDRELASVTGFSKQAITDAKRILKNLGLIDFHSKKGKPTIYNLPQFEARQLLGRSAGHKAGQSLGQSSRFSVASSSEVKPKDLKNLDARAHETEADSDCDWLYLKVAQNQSGGGGSE